MIQRKQSVWLLVAVVLMIVTLCTQIGSFNNEGLITGAMYNLWITDENGQHNFTTWPLFAILVFTTIFTSLTIFAYKNRMMQARFCVFNILLIVGWYVVYGVMTQVAATGTFHPSLTAALPAVAIVFLWFARSGVIADEKLVRAADRIR